MVIFAKKFVLKKIELLSPAKNLEVGIAAINHGADAVYIGGPSFGAREKVGNSIEDIEKLCNHAAVFGAKVYVTLNTLLFDNELEQARKIAWDCYNAGVDALIVQDMALLMMDMPPIALHASTQCNNTTAEKVKFLEDVGFKQVVLARELSINEIKEIRSKTTVPLEFFVHGALCVSYSGQCYLSHVIGHRSANRGACAQPCRLKWNLEDENGNVLIANRHMLSLRDMNNSKNLEELIDAGITSFKIEGRLKDADYVKNTTAFYRQAIDEIIEKRPDLERASRGVSTPSFVPNLDKSFSRGFTDYFAHGRQKNIDAPFTPKSMGEYIGEIKKIDGKRLIVKLKEDVTLHNGDGLCFLDDDKQLQGFNVNGVEGNVILCSKEISPLPAVGRNDIKKIVISSEAKRSREISLYRNFDIIWQKSVENSTGNRKLPIRLELSETSEGLRLSSGNVSVCLQCQKDVAKNPEKVIETIRTKLSQWGDTKFVVENIDIQLDTVYFIPTSILGEMKRQLVTELEKSLIERHRVGARHFDRPQGAEKSHSIEGDFSTTLEMTRLSYLGNVTNSLSRKFYENHGVPHIDDGLEKTMPDGEIVVMTTKHCIRYANGMCSKEIGKPATPLYITNERGRFRLDFDCKKCCMKVVNI
ncbi:MAG: U32 family peptidase [Bacteroidales bacterium]|nr:U32 family peptidase [Bacteroidales bacterium]